MRKKLVPLVVPKVVFHWEDRRGGWSYQPCKVAANFKGLTKPCGAGLPVYR